jgi:hypothetical protein
MTNFFQKTNNLLCSTVHILIPQILLEHQLLLTDRICVRQKQGQATLDVKTSLTRTPPCQTPVISDRMRTMDPRV